MKARLRGANQTASVCSLIGDKSRRRKISNSVTSLPLIIIRQEPETGSWKNMEEVDDENGLFNINLSDTESTSSTTNKEESTSKHPRDYQSAAAFAVHKESWTAKVEVGEIWKTIDLPIQNPSKPESQTILHAVEELYFFGRYKKALDVVEAALQGQLDDGFRKTIEGYRVRCEAKLSQSSG